MTQCLQKLVNYSPLNVRWPIGVIGKPKSHGKTKIHDKAKTMTAQKQPQQNEKLDRYDKLKKPRQN